MLAFNMKRDIGLIITEYESLSKCISIIRKYRNASMADIKNEIESQHFIYTCDFTDTTSLHHLIACHDELCDAGATLIIQEQNRPITRDILGNLSQMHKEIHEENLVLIDAELGENEE